MIVNKIFICLNILMYIIKFIVIIISCFAIKVNAKTTNIYYCEINGGDKKGYYDRPCLYFEKNITKETMLHLSVNNILSNNKKQIIKSFKDNSKKSWCEKTEEKVMLLRKLLKSKANINKKSVFKIKRKLTRLNLARKKYCRVYTKRR